MLILSCRIGEKLILGDDIAIKILGLKGNQTLIGVDAPKVTILETKNCAPISKNK